MKKSDGNLLNIQQLFKCMINSWWILDSGSPYLYSCIWFQQARVFPEHFAKYL